RWSYVSLVLVSLRCQFQRRDCAERCSSLWGWCLSRHSVRAKNKPVGDDHVHRYIVRLRIDRVQLCVGRGDPDGKRPALRGCERAIVVTAAVAESKVGAIEAQEGNDEHVRIREMALTRDRDVEYTARGTHARVPQPELHWGVFGHDDRKSRLAPCSQVHAGEF